MIRHAEWKDISRIAEIIIFGKRVAYRPIFHNDYVSFQELQVVDLAEKYKNNPERLEHMLVYDDGIVKGVINRKILGNSMELCKLYVEPFFKGKGIGSKLLQHVITEARAADINRIYLWVIQDNLPARTFYEKNGFKANGETCLIEGTDKMDMCYEYLMK